MKRTTDKEIGRGSILRRTELWYIKDSTNRAQKDLEDALEELIKKGYYEEIADLTLICLKLKDWKNR